jgi:hypothetical protein
MMLDSTVLLTQQIKIDSIEHRTTTTMDDAANLQKGAASFPGYQWAILQPCSGY